MKHIRLVLVASLTALTGIAMAASDGTLGGTTRGESVLSMTKDQAVQITNVGDIALGVRGVLAANAVESDDVCVFSSTGGYGVTILSTTNGTSFALTAGGNTDIPYSITWATTIDTTPATMVYGDISTTMTGNSTDTTCDAGTNATFEITVTAADFNAADPGAYGDTLILLIEPIQSQLNIIDGVINTLLSMHKHCCQVVGFYKFVTAHRFDLDIQIG